MEPLVAILEELRPRGVLEIGRDRGGRAWTAVPELVGSQVVEVAVPDRSATQEALVEGACRLEAPLDLVVVHPEGDADVARRYLELLLGRAAPEGRFVVDGTLPDRFVVQIMLASVVSPELVQQVELMSRAIVVERGAAEAVDVVELDALFSDPFAVVP